MCKVYIWKKEKFIGLTADVVARYTDGVITVIFSLDSDGTDYAIGVSEEATNWDEPNVVLEFNNEKEIELWLRLAY